MESVQTPISADMVVPLDGAIQAPPGQPADIRSAGKPLRDNERKCLVTGELCPKEQLIRFVVGPDGFSIIPDLAQNLPGRGLWVQATHDAISTAVRKNLFSRAAKAPTKPAADLADQVAALLKKRALNFLGLACSAGVVVPGQAQVETALKGGKISLLLIAGDAGRDVEKLRTDIVPPGHGAVAVYRTLNRDELGSALGYDQMVYIGLKAHALTARLRCTLDMFVKTSSLSQKPIETDTASS